MLDIRNLAVSYGRIHVVRDLSFSLGAGDTLAILGPNGAGKTSAVEAIAGLIAVSAGRIVLDGSDITGRTADRIVRAGLALVTQRRDLFPSFSVEETLVTAQAAAEDRVRVPLDEIYDLFPRLAERRSQVAGTLSGGEQQMLAISRALVTRPKVLVLDEPSAGLAVGIVDVVIATLKRIVGTGLPIVVVEQNIHLAASLAERCIVMSGGRQTWQGATRGAAQNDAIISSYFG